MHKKGKKRDRRKQKEKTKHICPWQTSTLCPFAICPVRLPMGKHANPNAGGREQNKGSSEASHAHEQSPIIAHAVTMGCLRKKAHLPLGGLLVQHQVTKVMYAPLDAPEMMQSRCGPDHNLPELTL